MLEETRTSENQALSFARQATEVDATDAVHAVPAIVARYLTESTSEATRRGYDADLRKFFEWEARSQRQPILSPYIWPSTPRH